MNKYQTFYDSFIENINLLKPYRVQQQLKEIIYIKKDMHTNTLRVMYVESV